MSGLAHSYGAYKRVGVETASQGKLVTMLFDGAIRRAEQAKAAIEAGAKPADSHNHLVRAQEIVAELRSALNFDMGEVAHNLDRIYEYFIHLLVKANLNKDTAAIDECIALMREMRETWAEVFANAEASKPMAAQPPRLNQHGNALMDLEG